MCASVNNTSLEITQPQQPRNFQWNLLPSSYVSSYSKQQTFTGFPNDIIQWSASDAEKKYIFVNDKQYNRIMKRRNERRALQFRSISSSNKQKFKYESRHLHAMNRQRGEGGRFCSKKKIEQSQVSNTTSPQQLIETTLIGSDNPAISPIESIQSVQLNSGITQTPTISYETNNIPVQLKDLNIHP
ncbi:CCAAT-binding transcription factor, putative [Entamoeba histolytica HM-1:IMSS-B]|uniref:Nuclear transcription factor Y subunit n=6 Tax=Entamoeba histolytica TaxID=5759 RepID=C4M6U7_ENTH1|nr:CCAAT-binding transcription factor, putative [Entamoeba histolytica HM-1:IMSS]EMD48854.1 ccaatbinding transcription factor, putative [Entamoeba histolytica KU27]EMH73534.1 CCAAT-binding transcription factor, putative [Entamoeba histolytica HM-1:IMSS-B]EMS16334.1 CCAAT-binding transcription factor, putative [Entamoeba histolytica HM-3:IMSS]ENY60720.1 CCAAT-binding transcription factor, putative [Entamoeba histolytica HM-1:IMSS-A]GAT97215.1 CCAAT-binding transcription factor putative [Entamoe|eukprot:XP_651413.1 CCAAT-binding transcription factor, putative [Entamoeba histolytica HM-1:IMSS]